MGTSPNVNKRPRKLNKSTGWVSNRVTILGFTLNRVRQNQNSMRITRITTARNGTNKTKRERFSTTGLLTHKNGTNSHPTTPWHQPSVTLTIRNGTVKFCNLNARVSRSSTITRNAHLKLVIMNMSFVRNQINRMGNNPVKTPTRTIKSNRPHF